MARPIGHRAFHPTPDWTLGLVSGGRSTRMGTDKGMLMVDGVPNLVRLARIAEEAGIRTLFAAGRTTLPSGCGRLAPLPDAIPGQGPLGGIATVLARTDEEAYAVVLPCDLPLLTLDAFAWLVGLGAKLPVGAAGALAVVDGHPQPLVSLWSGRTRGVVEACLARKQFSVRGAAQAAGLMEVTVPPPLGAAFRGANTPEEWDSLLSERRSRD